MSYELLFDKTGKVTDIALMVKNKVGPPFC